MYPISISMKDKRAMIFGGGRVALRKLQRLIEEGARVQLVAPRVLPEIEALVDGERVRWDRCTHDKYHGDLQDTKLLFAATDSPRTNRYICRYARRWKNILVNNATDPEDCDFQLPARVCRGDLELTVDTGGDSPGFARLVRQDMDQRYHDGFGKFLEWLSEQRQALMDLEPDTRRRQQLWREAMTEDVFNLVLNHRLEQAKDEVRRKIGSAGAESSHSTGRDS